MSSEPDPLRAEYTEEDLAAILEEMDAQQEAALAVGRIDDVEAWNTQIEAEILEGLALEFRPGYGLEYEREEQYVALHGAMLNLLHHREADGPTGVR